MTKPYEETADSLYVSLKGGQYWRATQDIKLGNDEAIIAKDTVLLLQSVRDIEEQAHTVILRPHPDVYAATAKKWRGTPGEYRFLVQDFLSKFVLEPDYKRVREAELARVQGRMEKLQKELAEANANPTVLRRHAEKDVKQWVKKQKLLPELAATLPDVPEQPEVIDQTLTAEKVEHMKLSMAKTKVIAESTALWIKKKVEQIGETVQAMAPYYQEQAAAIQATTEDVRAHVAQLETGLQSLDLYIGTGVTVRTLREGAAAADPAVPLTIMQAKLMMDEELSVWADIGEEFDFQSQDLFFENLLKHESLVNQIFPTERCIVCMATTEREIHYSDNPWVQAMSQQLNKNVFLLVRNGENLYVVHSPIESHTSRTNRLFPSAQEMEEIFTKKEWNWETHEYDKTPITFRDVTYTDKMSNFEAAAVHYKRFLILLAGLDHRLNLFGTFYKEPKGMNFMTPLFQHRYMKFIHDDDGEGLLPLENLPDFHAYVGSRNAYLRSGSRVICRWRDVMSPETAPGCVKYDNNYHRHWTANPVHRWDTVVAAREGVSIVVKAQVTKESWSSGTSRGMWAEVNLSRFLEESGREVGFLVLDAVKAADLETYIYDRNSRKDFISYIRLFKAAVKELRAEEVQEAPTRAALRQALSDGGVCEAPQADLYIDAAVIAWRASNRGAKLPPPSGKEFRGLLDQLYTLAKSENDWQLVERLVAAENRKPLRLVVSGRNKLSVYATPLENEGDEILFPMPWVMNIELLKDERGQFKESNRRWQRLPALTASETTLHQWAEAEKWKDRVSPVEEFAEKQQAMQEVQTFDCSILRPMTAEVWDKIFASWLSLCRWMSDRKRNRRVANPYCYVPIGLEYNRSKNRLRFVAVGETPEALLYRHAPDAERKQKIVEAYSERYLHANDAKRRILSHKVDFHLVKFDVDEQPNSYGLAAEIESARGFGYGSFTNCGGFQSESMTAALKALIQKEQEDTFNDAPSKVFWLPGFGVDTTNDPVKKKAAQEG